jgi:mannobiose 2-epimerase
MEDKIQLITEMYEALTTNLLEKWYPLSIDREYGGYYTNITYDMKLMSDHEKMLVTQARHIWSNSKAAEFLGNKNYKEYALHGFRFLKEFMWDNKFGGFYQMRSRDGGECDAQGFYSEKRTYGNAFAIYCLAALYKLSNDRNILELAKQSVDWIEDHAYDEKYKGYFQFLTREGKLISPKGEFKTIAFDEVESAFNDQNSSIHMLEAYTELYSVSPDKKLERRLTGLLELIRDKMTHHRGYLQLFFEYDWTPVSFRDAEPKIREQNYRLDHVSFGHDYETAFLMLEASHILGLEKDSQTLLTAKKMIDHAIANGWDEKMGGFYDQGYYFAGENKCTIIKETKNWWAQAEGLNALLFFSKIFPGEEKYYELFLKLWNFVKLYVIDQEHGDWYWGSLDKEPNNKYTPKGSIWKGTYHNCRALMNCIIMLDDPQNPRFYNDRYIQIKYNFDTMIEHWQGVGKLI